MENLKFELKKQIITHLNLEGLTVDDIQDDMPLIGGGLGLDSIDALELIVLMDQHYQIKIRNPEEGKSVLHSVDSMARYIRENSGTGGNS